MLYELPRGDGDRVCLSMMKVAILRILEYLDFVLHVYPNDPLDEIPKIKDSLKGQSGYSRTNSSYVMSEVLDQDVESAKLEYVQLCTQLHDRFPICKSFF